MKDGDAEMQRIEGKEVDGDGESSSPLLSLPVPYGTQSESSLDRQQVGG